MEQTEIKKIDEKSSKIISSATQQAKQILVQKSYTVFTLRTGKFDGFSILAFNTKGIRFIAAVRVKKGQKVQRYQEEYVRKVRKIPLPVGCKPELWLFESKQLSTYKIYPYGVIGIEKTEITE